MPSTTPGFGAGPQGDGATAETRLRGTNQRTKEGPMTNARGRIEEGEDREVGEKVTRALWCPRCALAQGFTLYSEERETRSVRWGLVALPRARCDYCNR